MRYIPRQVSESRFACDCSVPYILSLQIKRFDYDWELDRRVKLDDMVVFIPISTRFVVEMMDFIL